MSSAFSSRCVNCTCCCTTRRDFPSLPVDTAIMYIPSRYWYIPKSTIVHVHCLVMRYVTTMRYTVYSTQLGRCTVALLLLMTMMIMMASLSFSSGDDDSDRTSSFIDHRLTDNKRFLPQLFEHRLNSNSIAKCMHLVSIVPIFIYHYGKVTYEICTESV